MQRLVLWVDEDAVTSRQVVDVTSGEVRKEEISPAALSRELKVAYLPMTPAIKALVLYQRKGRGNGSATPVTVGDLGPYVLARVVDGAVQNGFGVHDIPNPMRLSAGTLRELAMIFGGKIQTVRE